MDRRPSRRSATTVRSRSSRSGGAAYLIAKAITKSTLLAFPDLGMEAIYEFEVRDMPVTVSVDSGGESVHVTGPQIWAGEIENRIRTRSVD